MAYSLPLMAVALLTPLLLVLLQSRFPPGGADRAVTPLVPLSAAALAVPYTGIVAAISAMSCHCRHLAPCCGAAVAGAALGFAAPLVVGPLAFPVWSASRTGAVLGAVVLLAVAALAGWRFGRWSLGRRGASCP